MSRARLLALLIALVALLLLAPAAGARTRATTVRTSQGTITTTRGTDGVRHLSFRWGPVRIAPGQNTISIADDDLLPPGPGWITSFSPNLTYVDGRVPRVDVIHLHHAVWIVGGRPTWAAGEEKTAVREPKGFGWRYRTSDRWLLNHMIHNLTPVATRVYITWTMDFIPLGARAARGMHEVRTQWVDAEGGSAYPVFDAIAGTGHDGRVTFPDDASCATARSSTTTPHWSGPPGTCTPAGCGPTSSSRAAGARWRSSAHALTTTSPPVPSPGTCR
jgi:hypothetical protein